MAEGGSSLAATDRAAQADPAAPGSAEPGAAGAPQAGLPARPEAGEAAADLPGAAPQGAAPPLTGKSRPPGLIRQYELVEKVKAYDPDADAALLDRAYVFAMRAHGGQMRSSGDPYFSHPLAVASILTELKLDPATIATALLHDVVEDTEVSVEEIAERFGEEVAGLVDGVTKISARELSPDVDGKAESFAKFILATAKDVRVLLVKLADRLHNMRTLDFVREEKRQRISRETMEIYAPLAGRIGVQQIKEELEDLSFRHLYPDAYAAITEGLQRLADEAVHDVVALAHTLRAALAEASIEAEVYSREKRAFSIWRKMQRKKSLFEELADIYAFRVIVPATEDCYRALGVIHRSFPMIPGEFDDYISTPKPNNYQSIHTAVLVTGEGRAGTRVEVQIRSKRMHDTAERGIAAHWRYKDAAARQATGRTVEIAPNGRYDTYEWLRGAVDALQEGGDASEFLKQAKIDLYRDQVFPFTPRGRVIPLPHGATGLDFAYALHTQIGDTYAGVRINGVVRPNRTPLRSGDVVEILRADDAPIPADWDRLVVTGSAKTGIRRRIKQLEKREQHKLGERIVTSAFAARDLPYSEAAVREAAKRLGFRGLKPLLEAAGRLELSGQQIVDEVFPNLDGSPKTMPHKAIGAETAIPAISVSIEGVSRGAAIRLAECCGPLPGERIVGIKGEAGTVRVHRIDCPRLALADDKEWLNLSWSEGVSEAFVAPIVVTVNNRTGAIGHIGSMLARYGADIVDMTLAHREVEFSDLCFDIAVTDARHLANVLTGLRASDYVVSAERREAEQREQA
ncbi:RelA/SpoT family protein [Parvularcula oceani]|uniref:RelA/SpoT family protein n=1 Tax=Parvularcula oceani TaxID=1247963 RepID=UPI00068D10B6|nr:bifunctional (p)ppGpp synthetase/guanosine-3',5'-bis(diphosphate) 3'-pyrophosphohydrolase [Parvularcula oceani]